MPGEFCPNPPHDRGIVTGMVGVGRRTLGLASACRAAAAGPSPLVGICAEHGRHGHAAHIPAAGRPYVHPAKLVPGFGRVSDKVSMRQVR